MCPKRSSVTLFLGVIVLLMGFLAGCGGEGQSGDGSQEGGPGEAKKQGGGEDAQRGASGTKIALGRVTSVDTEARTIRLRPSTEVQGEKSQRFKVKEDATITLDDKEAELDDAKAGQDAQITYVVRKENDVNVARVVALVSSGS
jgi:hypothetical protein